MKLLTTPCFAAAAASMVLLWTGCAEPPRRPAGLRLFAFVDLSASIKPGRQSFWERDSKKLVRAIGPGWSVAIYAVRDQTLSAGPLFTAEIPSASDDGGIDEMSRLKAAVRAARAGASEAFRKAFHEAGRARATDVFGAVDRIVPDREGRPTVAVFFSDMIHSTHELDMERGALPGSDATELFRALARRHFWHGESLRGVRVYCLLNSRPSGSSGPDRLVLKRFYATLFKTLGADLALFDTHADSWDLMKGTDYARN